MSAIDCDYIHAENGLGKIAVYSADKDRDIMKFLEANQHTLHISSLDETDKHTLLSLVTEDKLPRNVFHGDGSDIQVDDLRHILDVYQSEHIVFQWQRGDVMILDNVLMAHGRKPFLGERKIVVAMSGDD
jgi:alpha-ketoglutarate-dependent taurine dioxygenase